MTIEKISETVVFGGSHQQFTHMSTAVKCEMRFAIYLPPKALYGEKVPVIYWLSGLTCTDENFMQKAGALRIASALNIAIVAPDTSPRGSEVPNDDGYDLGKVQVFISMQHRHLGQNTFICMIMWWLNYLQLLKAISLLIINALFQVIQWVVMGRSQLL